jgi:hypothetical protein
MLEGEREEELRDMAKELAAVVESSLGGIPR